MSDMKHFKNSKIKKMFGRNTTVKTSEETWVNNPIFKEIKPRSLENKSECKDFIIDQTVQASEKQTKRSFILDSDVQATSDKYENNTTLFFTQNVDALNQGGEYKNSSKIKDVLPTKENTCPDSVFPSTIIEKVQDQFKLLNTRQIPSSEEINTRQIPSSEEMDDPMWMHILHKESQGQSKNGVSIDSFLPAALTKTDQDPFVLRQTRQISTDESMDFPVFSHILNQKSQGQSKNYISNDSFSPGTITMKGQGPSELRQISIVKSMDVPMLTHILHKTFQYQSKSEESLIILECMKRIEKWLDKLDEINRYNSERFELLIKKIIYFKRIEPSVQEKRIMLAIAKDLSYSDSEDCSDFEVSTYNNLYIHSERVLHMLTFYERYLNATLKRYIKLRARFIDCSIQITMYPFEEKLSENRKRTINVVNQCTNLMNKISYKLEETDNYTDKLSFGSVSLVEQFFRICDDTFSE